MMLAELLGGPLDAAMIDGPDEMPQILTIKSRDELLLYKARCCLKCARWRGVMKYEFAGYAEKPAPLSAPALAPAHPEFDAA